MPVPTGIAHFFPAFFFLLPWGRCCFLDRPPRASTNPAASDSKTEQHNPRSAVNENGEQQDQESVVSGCVRSSPVLWACSFLVFHESSSK